MKYKKQVEIYEDNQILENVNIVEVAEKTGFTVPYIYMLKNGNRVAPWKTYVKLIKALN